MASAPRGRFVTLATVSTPATGWASGKVILLGEHAVVHGQPAIAGPLRQGLCVTLTPSEGDSADCEGLHLRGAAGRAGRSGSPGRRDSAEGEGAQLREALRVAALDFPPGSADGLGVCVSGDLPEAVGLGSSAALSVALVRALAVAMDMPLAAHELARRANRVEAIFHGRPSGLDVAAAASSGWIRFRIGEPPEIRPLVCARALELVAIETGATHRTSETVGDVARRHAQDPTALEPLFRNIGGLVEEGAVALARGDLPELGRLMTANHEQLVRLGVSTSRLDQAVQAALVAGALGAKLTGGGGGGLVMALVGAGERERAVAALGARGWQSYGLMMAMTTPAQIVTAPVAEGCA